MKIVSIIGARPQFIKVAPIARILRDEKNVINGVKMSHKIIHTGQHYDYFMNKVFFDQLDIPVPDVNLEVGSGPHAVQTGNILQKVEGCLIEDEPNLVIVYGDTNSTLAGALAAAKLHIPVAHVESGLRSYNRRMPEEINRILTDHCSDILCVPTVNAFRILKKEGFDNFLFDGNLAPDPDEKWGPLPEHFPVGINVGDMMYDAVRLSMEVAEQKSRIMQKLKLEPQGYFLATLHRAENTDDHKRLREIVHAFREISLLKPVIFPAHPRTQKMLKTLDLDLSGSNIHLMEPVGYFDMLILLRNAWKLLTDSGGMQKEAYFLNVPCITLRDETEWVETLQDGKNVLVGSDSARIISETKKPSLRHENIDTDNPFGDGRSASRFLKLIAEMEGLLCAHQGR
ncbi:MAG: UDP-N-acetyl glucosamine 2-epimerase [Acidobacteria bacterium]|nr:UDP-N-acetyl glucosamine 2-epimerase [Acidobacteriota bacterium]